MIQSRTRAANRQWAEVFRSCIGIEHTFSEMQLLPGADSSSTRRCLEEGPPYIQRRKDRDRIIGEYHIALQNGTLDGRPQRDGSVLLSFEGMDEMDEVHGAGTARLQGDRLVFTLMYHQGDDYTFECTRRS